jgi:hypothetical protein
MPRKAITPPEPQYVEPLSYPLERTPVRSVKKRVRPRHVVWALLGVLALGIISNAYFFLQYQKLKQNPAAVQEQEAKELVDQVGSILLLPSEVPTIATVLDPDMLKQQAFFEHAIVGDKVLVFASARQAVLYRPSEHKIIAISMLSSQDMQQTPAVEAEADTVAE